MAKQAEQTSQYAIANIEETDKRFPVYGDPENHTANETEYCDRVLNGWAISTGSGVEGRDILKYGFVIQNNVLFPDDIQRVRELLKDAYTVKVVTPPYKPGQEISRKTFKLTSATYANSRTRR